jgi:hypothetical protein
MDPSVIPEDVARFIQEKIDSVAQMEALLLLRKHQAQQWSLTALAQRLYIGEGQTADVLARLVADGLVVPAGAADFRYHAASPELESMVERVTEAYRTHLVPVTNLIHSKPRTRIQEFADAFRFRKKEE